MYEKRHGNFVANRAVRNMLCFNIDKNVFLVTHFPTKQRTFVRLRACALGFRELTNPLFVKTFNSGSQKDTWTDVFLCTRKLKTILHIWAHETDIPLWHPVQWRLVLPRFSQHMWQYAYRRKPSRCYWMIYCTYNLLNMFRALTCPSSGARDYTCVIIAYGV